MTSRETHSPALVAWADGTGFDVERAEKLAATFRAPWEAETPAVSQIRASHAPPGNREVLGTADTLVAPPSSGFPESVGPAASHAPQQPPSISGVSSGFDEDVMAVPVRKSRRAWMLGLGAAVLLATGLAAMALLRQEPQKLARITEKTAPPNQTTAAASAKPPLPPPAEGVASRVKATITVVPSSANLWVDGQQVPNPYFAEFDKSSSHVIEAKASGYEARELHLKCDEPRDVAVRLKPEPAEKPEKAVAKRDSRPGRKTRTEPRTRPKRVSTKASPKKGVGFITDNPY
ncbi:MAG: hypothetical protein H6714_10290 [Myxococcales bacterium]|nr:hypothetical protein [Myxococcales bacterium]